MFSLSKFHYCTHEEEVSNKNVFALNESYSTESGGSIRCYIQILKIIVC